MFNQGVHWLVLTKGLLDKGVVCQWNALLPDLAISTLVDELTHRFKVGVPENKSNMEF